MRAARKFQKIKVAILMVYDLLSIFSCVIVVAMNISLFGGAAVVQA